MTAIPGSYITLETLPDDGNAADKPRITTERTTHALIARLDAVEQRAQKAAICSVCGPAGSGKSALISHWLATRPEREACNPQMFPLYIQMGQQKAQLPQFYSMYRTIWRALHKAAGTEYKLKDRQGKERYKSFSYRNAEYLKGNIDELLERIPINAIIIDGADHLDKQAIEETITFRVYHDERYGPKPRRALILVATTEEGKKLQMSEHLMKIGEARAAWSERIELRFLEEVEFALVLFKLVHVNLKAEFGPRLDVNKATTEFHQLTRGDWHNIATFADELENALSFSQGRRVVTREMLDRVKRKLTKERIRA
jgi:energy-coupling factor transporter ATP-binding protein EcfA2